MKFQVTSPYIFFPAAAIVVGYLLYMMIRKRRGERPDSRIQEPDL